MLNPRDTYISACFKNNQLPEVDYYHYNQFEIRGKNDSNVKKLAKFLLDNDVGSKSLAKAYNIFKNFSIRITIEGLLLNNTIEEVAEIQKVNVEVIKTYASYFFNTVEIKDNIDKTHFLKSIKHEQYKKVFDYFEYCLRTNKDDLNFLSNREAAQVTPIHVFNKLLQKEFSKYEAFDIFDVNTVLGGLSEKQAHLLSLSRSSKNTLVSLLQMYLKNSDKFQDNEEDFITKYEMLLEEVRIKDFDIKEVDDAEEKEILKQLEDLNAITESEQKLIDNAKNVKDTKD